jgi:carbon-monoxide dehydrogenase medium subunit
VPELDRIDLEEDAVAIGANVTYADLAAHPFLLTRVPCLAQMADQVGSVQIRNMARLPGNIANASPAGDSIATLMALDATVRVLDGAGRISERRVDAVVTGIGRTTLQRGEAIVQVRIPRPGPLQRSAYGKVGMGARSRVVIANISLTLVLDYDPAQGRIRDPRVVLGSAAPVAFHAAQAEALLAGRRPDPALAGELAEVLRAQVKASIKEIAIFQHKLNDIRGLALDLFAQLFPGEL